MARLAGTKLASIETLARQHQTLRQILPHQPEPAATNGSAEAQGEKRLVNPC